MRHDTLTFTEETHRGRTFLIGLTVALLLLAAGLFTWNFALNHTVQYEKKYVTIANLPEPLENFSILHLSDLNGSSLGENLSALRKVLADKSPSVAVLSGNMIGQSGDISPVLQLADILPKGTPILLLPGDDDPSPYATGAHGSLSPYADWAQQLKDAGVTILDEPYAITKSKKTVWFIPETLYSLDLDSTEAAWQALINTLNMVTADLTPDQAAQKRSAQFQVERLQRIRETLAAVKESDVQVCVTHMPLTRSYVSDLRAATPEGKAFSMSQTSLILAGGYCGGQWRIPGVGAVWAPDLGFFPEDSQLQGLTFLGGVWQHTSPGLGVNGLYPLLPYRIFNSPAATLLVLSSSVH